MAKQPKQQPPITTAQLSTAFDMPLEDAIAYLKAKAPRVSWDWDEVAGAAAQKAFSVAKLMDLNLLTDVHNAVIEAQTDRQTFEDFKKNLAPKLKAAGWWGKQDVVNPKTGKVEKAQLGSAWRLDNIYRTNMQSSMNAGRLAQMKAVVKFRPFWIYDAVGDYRTRPKHKALDGVIQPADSDFWKTHFTPNGFQCRCRVRSLSKREMERDGLRVTPADDERLKIQPDAGFDVEPGNDTSTIDSVIKDALGKAPPELREQFKKAAADLLKKAAEAPDPLQPAAKPTMKLSDRLDFDTYKMTDEKIKAVVVRATKVLDGFVSPAVPLVIPIYPFNTKKYPNAGGLCWMKPGKMEQIISVRPKGRKGSRFDKEGDYQAFAYYHEVGHALDASHRLDTAPVVEAFKKTEAYKLCLLKERKARKYYLDPTEIWARAFSQYVSKHGDAEAHKAGPTDFAVTYGSQWSDEEFSKTIEPAVVDVLKKAGIFKQPKDK